VPYLRGYGPTRFLSASTPRSGQQAVLAHDLRALMDALGIERALLAGFDWGGRAACIVAALWPERVLGLVSGGGYNIQHLPSAGKPQAPEREHQIWYQYYFHGERGRAGLEKNRYDLGRLLWRLWSPSWRFDEATYDRTAASFENPDFVEVVIHSYRHRFRLSARRSRGRGDGSAPDRAAAHHGSDRRDARARQRRDSARELGGGPALLHRSL
jgi:pimeloyl-ACP methyl ester carboxylesterase